MMASLWCDPGDEDSDKIEDEEDEGGMWEG